MNSLIPATRSVSTSRWMAVLFALGVLAVGAIPGRLTFALDPNATTRIGLHDVPVPAWVFTTVWLVAYPGMGVATWLVWRTRGERDISVPIAIFIAALLQTLSFWLTNSLHMTAVLDAIGVLLAYTVAWVYSRYRRAAVWWLLPWLVWMPITLGIKLWVVLGGGH
jgi:translocator protein